MSTPEFRALAGPALLAGGLCAIANLSLWRLPRFWRERTLDNGPHVYPLARYAIGCAAIGAGLAAYALDTRDARPLVAYAAITGAAGCATALCYAGHHVGDARKAARRAPMAVDAESAAFGADPYLTALLKGTVQ